MSAVGRWLLLAALVAYLFAVGWIGQPSVHPFYDGVAMRDSGTVWHSLTWSIKDQKYFLPVAVLSRNEGPLQFLLLNLYEYTVGNLLPLNPRTMMLPNIVLAALCIVLVYGLGRRLHSPRFGWLCALTLALSPWVVIAVRLPWIFNLLSVAAELLVLWFFVGLAQEPERRLYRVGAPLSVALYLLTGLDWPAFLLVLAVFVVLTGRLGALLRNRVSLVPAAVVAVYAAWAAALFVYGRWFGPPQHADLYKRALLLFPFFKVSDAPPPSVAHMAAYAWSTFGIVLPLAAIGLAGWLLNWKEPPPDGAWASARTRALGVMGLWLLVALIPLLKASNAETYGYVAAIPLALWGAACLLRLSGRWFWSGLTAAVLVMLFSQYQALAIRLTPRDADDRRVLAAAAFLIEKRPDLLAPGKTALLPGDEAAAVGQYARGRKTGLVMPRDFPVELKVHSVASPEKVLLDFVESYTARGELKADWIVLSCEMLLECETPAGATKAVDFYRKLRADPRIRWIALFKDQRGRFVLIGEVGAAAGSVGPVPEYPIEALAAVYEAKYDRIRFLKHDLRHVMHE
ncbi:MAG TPA: hypothetical protein VFO18_05670 [Methylomirabilota bacterium]|nr:hypothetical protein [Methylomirabilota bacterium]